MVTKGTRLNVYISLRKKIVIHIALFWYINSVCTSKDFFKIIIFFQQFQTDIKHHCVKWITNWQSLPCTFTDGSPLALKDIWEGVHECYKTRLLHGPWDTITQQVREYFHCITCDSFPLLVFSSSSLSYFFFSCFTPLLPYRFQFKDSFL